jgi:hypothetical protein
MATTYTLISSNVLGSSTATVTFSSIPATYTDLVLRVSGRFDGVSRVIGIYFNNAGGASTLYSWTQLSGNGSSISSGRGTANMQFQQDSVVGSGYTADTFGSIEMYIPNYLVSQNKPVSIDGTTENNATGSFRQATAGLWSSTAAINRIDLISQGGQNFVSGSSFYLYGIKNS